MSNEMDDLEALFEAEAARFGQAGGQAAAAETPCALAESGADTTSAADAAVAEAGADGLERYYHSVSGLNLKERSAAPADGADPSMYERLGSIVRQLHDSLRSLGYDKSLATANSQISEAKDRLEHISALTEQSAVKVLNTLEAAMPAQEAMIRQGREMEERWAQLFAGKTGVEEFKVLAADARSFAAGVAAEGEREKARLLEIMMAQDFQDLTGQIIKKMVGVTKSIEQELAQLLLDNAPAATKEKHVELMAGPSAPGVALVQGDVDDMLAELGF